MNINWNKTIKKHFNFHVFWCKLEDFLEYVFHLIASLCRFIELFCFVDFHDCLCPIFCPMKCRHCVQPYTDSPRGFWDTLHWRMRLGGRHVAAVFLFPRDRRTSRVGHIWSSLPFFSPRGISTGQAYTGTWGHFVRLINCCPRKPTAHNSTVSIWMFQLQFILRGK